jgi:hypothetical protein
VGAVCARRAHTNDARVAPAPAPAIALPRALTVATAPTLSLCGLGGNRLYESLNYELYGYGPQAVPAPPPASQVTDITARLKAQFAKGLQELSCSK